MAGTNSWQLLFVDDDDVTCRQVKEYLEGETILAADDRPRVETLTDFGSALEELEVHRVDLLMLDVRLGPHEETREEEAGITTLEAVRKRCFVPVVFYTALPHRVRELGTPVVRVVDKTDGLSRLLETVREIFATGLPAVNRALIRHLETVQRDYMWDFVAEHWGQFGDTPDRTALAYLLARRLAMSLSGPGIRQLAQDLGDASRAAVTEGCVHPMEYYLIPPVAPAPLTGDLYQGEIGDEKGYWILLTPSCDLATGREKADWVLLARCVPLAEQAEYQKWEKSLPDPSNKVKKGLQDLLRNSRRDAQKERFHFLPGALTVPDLVVDFQQLMTLPRSQLGGLERLASLDGPFAGELPARFVRYFGRLGTPDLDLNIILSRLERV